MKLLSDKYEHYCKAERALRAIKAKRRGGWTYAWFMARASYEYSRARGLTRREAFGGAWELFWEKL